LDNGYSETRLINRAPFESTNGLEQVLNIQDKLKKYFLLCHEKYKVNRFNLSAACAQVTEISTPTCYLMEIK